MNNFSLQKIQKRFALKNYFSKFGKKLAVGALLFLLIFIALQRYIAFSFNTSDSISPGIYILTKFSIPENYDDYFVFYRMKNDGILSKDLMISKRIYGKPGDLVIFNKEKNQIEIQRKKSILQLANLNSGDQKSGKLVIVGGNTTKVTRKDLIEKKFKPQLIDYDFVIPEGYFFAKGDSLSSFDSRYKEFGLVPIKDIVGKAWKIYDYHRNEIQWPSPN